MNERITLISIFTEESIQKIDKIIDKLDERLCKVPFGKNVDNRKRADTLPHHFTISTWSIEQENQIVKDLSNLQFKKFHVLVDNIDIMNGAENSLVLYFNVQENNVLKELQKKVYKIHPNSYYNPESFHVHITIHIDKDKNKIMEMKETLQQNFSPFELEINSLGLFEIYPAKQIQEYKEKK